MRRKRRQLTRALIALLVAAPFVAVAPVDTVQAQAGELTCNGHMRMVFLSSKPLKVNPGKCRYARINLRIEMMSPTDPLPRICLFAKAVGSAKEYGPFCSEGATSGLPVPGIIEWLWSNRGVETGLKFCNTRDNCR